MRGDPRRVARLFLAKEGDPYHPPGHSVGTLVPKGGSSCANCAWTRPGKRPRCANKYFQRWRREEQGSTEPAVLPAPPDEYCCDVWTPRQE